MDLSYICKIIGHFMFYQSEHSKIVTIIYLINHSTSKLFNEVCIQCNQITTIFLDSFIAK